MTAAADPVEALYRDYPYPGHGVISAVAARMLGPAVERARARAGRGATGRLRLLDAGCGTGEQALGIARQFPDIEVVGVDFSAASLTMARALKDKSRIDVRFERRDLTASLADLGRFDLVVSIGVLHHLPEPRIGFARLAEVVSPGGELLGMVYGKFGKWSTFQIRDALGLVGGQASREERLALLRDSNLADNTGIFHYLETLRRRARFGPSIPWTEAARRTLAGRSPAYQADTFTHAREAVYSWAELDALLTTTGWRFDGWPRRSGMPDEPKQLFRGRALEAMRRLPLLEQAAVYERILKPVCLYFFASAGSGGPSVAVAPARNP